MLLLASNEELSVAKAELKSQQENFENEVATLSHKLSLAEQQVRFLFAMLS
jgi:chaperonin cofactor prefoldin